MSKLFNQRIKSKSIFNKTFLKSSLVAGAFLFSGINQSAQANSKPIVAVEPLVCDVVSAIAPPSTAVTCLIDRKQDVHDVKITPRQAQTLKSANQVFTLGSEMTPAMKKWLDNPLTVVVGVSAIEIDDHHDDHDDHSAAKDDDTMIIQLLNMTIMMTMMIMAIATEKEILNGLVFLIFQQEHTNGLLPKSMETMLILQ